MILILLLAVYWIAAGIVFFIHQSKHGIGYSWITTTLTCFLGIGFVIGLYWLIPQQVKVNPWQSLGTKYDLVSLYLNKTNYPFLASLCALALTETLTSVLRFNQESRPIRFWINLLVTSGMGIACLLSGNLLTLLFLWFILDAWELLLWIEPENISTSAKIFAMRQISSAILMWVIGQKNLDPQTLQTGIDNVSAFAILFAVTIRCWLLPLLGSFSDWEDVPQNESYLSMVVIPFSGLSLLRSLSFNAPVTYQTTILTACAIFGLIYGCLRWTFSTQRTQSPIAFQLIFCSLSLLSALKGRGQDVVVWSSAMVLLGSFFFYRAHLFQKIDLLSFLAMISLAGLPFTPIFSAFTNIIATSTPLIAGVIMIFYSLFLIGSFRRALEPLPTMGIVERWMLATFPVGLTTTIAAFWAVSIINQPALFSLPKTFISFIPATTGILFLVLTRLNSVRIRNSRNPIINDNLVLITTAVAEKALVLFSLGWLVLILKRILTLIEKGVLFFTGILEGEAGVLWASLILSIILSILSSGGIS